MENKTKLKRLTKRELIVLIKEKLAMLPDKTLSFKKLRKMSTESTMGNPQTLYIRNCEYDKVSLECGFENTKTNYVVSGINIEVDSQTLRFINKELDKRLNIL